MAIVLPDIGDSYDPGFAPATPPVKPQSRATLFLRNNWKVILGASITVLTITAIGAAAMILLSAPPVFAIGITVAVILGIALATGIHLRKKLHNVQV